MYSNLLSAISNSASAQKYAWGSNSVISLKLSAFVRGLLACARACEATPPLSRLRVHKRNHSFWHTQSSIPPLLSGWVHWIAIATPWIYFDGIATIAVVYPDELSWDVKSCAEYKYCAMGLYFSPWNECFGHFISWAWPFPGFLWGVLFAHGTQEWGGELLPSPYYDSGLAITMVN